LRLVSKIEKQHIYDEAHKVLDLLKQNYDQEQIAYKLISVLMERNTVQGPNQIGIAAERLEKILHNLERRGNGRRLGGFSRNRNGGNRSRNSGGYRGNNDRSGSSERSDRGERGGNDRSERSRSFSGQKSKPRY
ncbi:MAG: DEAD/DEAH box helicase, partial [Epsilonproteobacteria bacterium]|nr:DEAD/DEAH box helicase [Campylobacterota bacterium]